MKTIVWIVGILFLAALPGIAADEAAKPAAAGKHVVYVSNLMSHTLSIVDLDGKGEFHNIEIGRYPIFSALHPTDPDKLIVSLHNYERSDEDDGLVLVDLRRERVVKKVGFPGPGMPSGFVHDAKRNRIYVADENLNRVFALDGITLDPIFDLPAGLIPVHVDISADGHWLAVTNRKSADLYVYDLDKTLIDAKEGIGTVHLGRPPACRWGDDGETAGKCSHPLDIKFGAEPDICYVTDYEMRQLLCVDVRKREVIARVDLPNIPFDFTLDRAKKRAYICLLDGDAVAVVDLAQRRIERVISGLGGGPIHCVPDEERQQLIVGCWGGMRSGGIHLVDLKTDRVLKSLPLKDAAASIGLTLGK